MIRELSNEIANLGIGHGRLQINNPKQEQVIWNLVDNLNSNTIEATEEGGNKEGTIK